MAPYVGTATSRIDGVAKVTGAAKYAAEFNTHGLLYGSIVTSTITKGRIRRIDASAAKGLKGVVDVLTHANRPRMADNDKAYKDDVAPFGSPFRPLYDDKIMFNGQPIALVVAETSEIARYGASLVRVEYERRRRSRTCSASAMRPFLSSLQQARSRPCSLRPSRADTGGGACCWAVRHEGEYYAPIEHHNPMELYGSTVMYGDGGKLTVYDKTQGVQNVQRYLCTVFGLKPEDVRVMSPFVGGAFGVGCGLNSRLCWRYLPR